VKISATLPTGVAALLFESAQALRATEESLAGRLRDAGYQEVVLPILDYVEPYASLAVATVRSETYRFIDRDGEILAIRSDFTPMLARLLAPRLPSLPLPLRLFYRGDVVRYEPQRPGRSRELYQLGAELLGVEGDEAEREVLTLFLDLASAVAEGNLQVVLGFAGALDDLLVQAGGDDPSALAAAVARRERAAVRSASPVLLRVIERGVPDRPEDLGAAGASLRRLKALQQELAARFPAVSFHLDLAEFAGCHLDPRIALGEGERPYYDGLVFRAYAGAAAVPVGGGGRYDRLFGALGAEVPAVGFSLALDRLLEACEGTAPHPFRSARALHSAPAASKGGAA
jgi:ATP phosphoribosyltransferase regulatory subunit HisZ